MQNKNPKKSRNLYSKYWGYTTIGKKWGARNRPKSRFWHCTVYYCKRLLSNNLQYKTFQRIQNLQNARFHWILILEKVVKLCKIKILKKTRNLYSKYWGYTQIGEKWRARNRPKSRFWDCTVYYCKRSLSNDLQYKTFRRIQHLRPALGPATLRRPAPPGGPRRWIAARPLS